MNIEYNAHRDEFALMLSRGEAIDMSVFLGLRSSRSWLTLNALGEISDELHRLLRKHPPIDACEHCMTAVTFVEGEWRHTETCRAYCPDGNTRATPKRED